MSDLQSIITDAYENRAEITPRSVSTVVKDAVMAAIEQLDRGEIRVAEKKNGNWVVNEWVKDAVLLFFRIEDNQFVKGGFTNYYDKVPAKYTNYNSRDFREGGVRVVPPASVRKGAYVAPSTVLVSSYVNIGAYVDAGTMIGTWTSVGSCAQIGKNVHLSAGVGIDGVLEPPQQTPCIIEDDCFIGARSQIAEGVIIERGSVLSMGVFLSQSTKIYNRETGEITFGRVPAGSVVVPGNLPAKDGSHSLYCAVIIKQVDEKTRGKVSINELLRDI